MSINCFSGNQTRAAQIARRAVRSLAVTDLESLVCDHLDETDDELCTAVDADYPTIQKRLDELIEQRKSLPEEARMLCDEVFNLFYQREGIRQIAWFNLGFQTALRLIGEPPEMHVVKGGAARRKVVAS